VLLFVLFDAFVNIIFISMNILMQLFIKDVNSGIVRLMCMLLMPGPSEVMPVWAQV